MMSNINHASILLIEQFKVMFSFYELHCAPFLIPLQLLYVVKMKFIRLLNIPVSLFSSFISENEI